jgi:hypothetical protein
MRYTISLVSFLCCIGAISPAHAACPTNDTCNFLYSGGTYTELTPKGSSSVASGINDKAAGRRTKSGGRRRLSPIVGPGTETELKYNPTIWPLIALAINPRSTSDALERSPEFASR